MKPQNGSYEGTINRKNSRVKQKDKSKTINIALVGNPNCGKTTLFNYISKSKEKVGNYSGVTVAVKKAKLKAKGYTFNFFDLPGTYSLTAYSNEEIFVRKFIYEQTPDIVINVIDSTNLERNLFLTTQLIDMDLRIVGALNMYDDLETKKIEFNIDELSSLLGIPFIPTISSKGIGLDKLIDKVIDVFEGKRYRFTPCPYQLRERNGEGHSKDKAKSTGRQAHCRQTFIAFHLYEIIGKRPAHT
jgi:ferrous iron transport protein B